MKNVSEFISLNAEQFPEKKSIMMGKNTLTSGSYPSYTFKEFDKLINQFCHKLTELGVKPQDKVLFFC